MTEADFEIGLGRGHYFKGRGWIGLSALFLLLLMAPAIVAAASELRRSNQVTRPIPAHFPAASFVQ